MQQRLFRVVSPGATLFVSVHELPAVELGSRPTVVMGNIPTGLNVARPGVTRSLVCLQTVTPSLYHPDLGLPVFPPELHQESYLPQT